MNEQADPLVHRQLSARFEVAAKQAIAMVRDALRHLKQFEKMREQAHAERAREVELGWADFDAGRVSDFDPEAIKAAGRERLARKGS